MIKEPVVYLKGLNGIRAIAAIGVLFSHINLSLKHFGVNNYSLFGFKNSNARGWNLGEQGVTMFFVLSGFLITFLLLKEKEKTNRIDIKKFYKRRILRIWPLYYFYLGISIASIILFSNQMPNVGILGFYVFLLANIPFIVEKALPACDHLWSIAVEEQFYLFWPHLFKKSNIENFFKYLIIIFCISVVIRLLLWMFFPFRLFTVFFTVNRFDCMVFGAICAIIVIYKPYLRLCIENLFVQLFAWTIVIIHFINFEIVNSIVSLEFMTLATGIIIIGQISENIKIVNLEFKLSNLLGKYSYGIYIYHPLLLLLFAKMNLFASIENELAKLVIVYVVVVFATIGIAIISYEVFEKRFIKLKENFAIIHSSNDSRN